MSGVNAARQDAADGEGDERRSTSCAQMGKRIGTVHLIDSDNTLHHDQTSTHAPFGEGVLDFDAIIEALKKVGYAGPWWTIDLCFWPTAWDIVEMLVQLRRRSAEASRPALSETIRTRKQTARGKRMKFGVKHADLGRAVQAGRHRSHRQGRRNGL